MPDTTNSVVLITGAAHRIGRALSMALHDKGFNVAIHYNKSNKASSELVEQLNCTRKNSAKMFQADLTKPKQIEKSYREIYSWHANITALINNASIFQTDDDPALNWDDLFNCNVRAPYLLSHLCFKTLKENKGCIINITDIHAKSPLKNYTTYCMTKAALEMQTKSFAKAFSPEIRVNAIAPGAILWPENQSEIDLVTKNKIINKTLLQTTGGTKPICQAVIHLMENSFITGTSLNIDGGRYVNI